MDQAKAYLEMNRRHENSRLSLLEWTVKNRRLLTLGRPFDLVDHKYLIDVYADECQELVVCKAGQTGISEYCISWVLWSADVRKCTGLYVFPTDTAVSDFAAARLGPAIELEVSPHLSQLVIPAAGNKGQRGADRVGLKRVGDRFVYFRGARVSLDGKSPQLRSVDADVLILDEYDEMDLRAPAIARERLGHSRVGDIREISTPTYAEMGIHERYLQSDMRVWMVKCTRCNRWQDLTIEDVVREWDELQRPVSWHVDDDGKAIVACRECNGELDRGGRGQWVATYPSRDVHGYHISRLFVPFRSPDEIVKGLRSIDEATRQQTYNQGLGLPYQAATSSRLTEATLSAARREYALKPGEGLTVCGVDVGPRQLHVVIRELSSDGNWRARYIGTVGEFEDLSRLLDDYNVIRCVCDALPETRKAREFQKAHIRGRVWLAYYDTHRSGARRQDVVKWEDKEWRATIDRTRVMDLVIAGLIFAANGEAGLTLPANARDITQYYDHMKAPQRVLQEDVNKNPIAVYIHTRADHYFHSEAYCLAAGLKGLRPSALPDMRKVTWEGDDRAASTQVNDPAPWSREVVEAESWTWS
jgi:hypothetical protein